jgi:SsrA-binding protein
MKVVATNRKAGFDYHLSDKVEAGISLKGSEIKSIRSGQVSLKEAYVQIADGEAWLMNAHVAPYNAASKQNHEPRRPRKLLLHRRELDRLAAKVREKGFTIIPTRMYLSKGRAKLEIALARGKRKYDKRKAIAERELRREIERASSRKQRR